MWREEKEWQRIAQLASWIMSPHVKKPISAEKLLGKSNKVKSQKKVTTEEKKATLDQLEQSIGFH